jgi:hypothetical protein
MADRSDGGVRSVSPRSAGGRKEAAERRPRTVDEADDRDYSRRRERDRKPLEGRRPERAADEGTSSWPFAETVDLAEDEQATLVELEVVGEDCRGEVGYFFRLRNTAEGGTDE